MNQEPQKLVHEIEVLCGVRVVRISGTVAHYGEILDREAFAVWLEAGERRFVINIAGISHMDSFAIGVLLACHKLAAVLGGVIHVVLSQSQEELFQLLKLDTVFPLYYEESEALAAFGPSRDGRTFT